MDNKYSFLELPALSILKDSLSLCPEIEKVIALYYNYNTANPEVKSVKEDKNDVIIEDLNIENQNVLLKLLYKKKHKISSSWYSDDELPFNLKTKFSIKPDSNKPLSKKTAKSKPEVFSESDKRVLVLTYPDDRDHKYIFYFFFNKNTSNFNMVNSDTVLTTENKSIICYFLLNSINTILKNNKNNLRILNILNDSSESAQKNNFQLKKDLESSKSNLKKCIIDLSEIYLRRLSDKYKKDYILTNQAKDKLSLYTGDISNLEQIIEKAVIVINNTNFNYSDNSINILDWHINFDIYENNRDYKEEKNLNEDEFIKPRKFLDEIEIAANELINRNIKFTSENLGKLLNVPITNAAISQKLKKYNIQITNILSENKEKYPKIRKYFKPIRKIINFKKLDNLYEKNAS